MTAVGRAPSRELSHEFCYPNVLLLLFMLLLLLLFVLDEVVPAQVRANVACEVGRL